MSILTYRAMKRQPAPEYETREVTVPSHWGMYTSAGNKSIMKKAQKLVNRIEGEKKYTKKLDLFGAFFKGWRKLQNTKNMSEASDTDVREQVWGFACIVAKAVNVDEESLDKIWDEL